MPWHTERKPKKLDTSKCSLPSILEKVGSEQGQTLSVANKSMEKERAGIPCIYASVHYMEADVKCLTSALLWWPNGRKLVLLMCICI